MTNEETKSDKDKSGRGKETLFRATYMNQINLIQLADQKATMIISINTLIITALIAISGYKTVADKVDLELTILAPLVIIIITCLISAIYAIQAAKPKVLKANDNLQKKEKSSLLFFGEIADYNQEEYLEKMDVMINSKKAVYEHMTIDIFNQGKILKRKYALLAIAYQVFLIGFVISVTLFLIILFLRTNVISM